MREAFSEFFVGEPDRQQKLWADCIFVLDTNVLLDLYRFSDSAREALFKVMESLGERLWIPYQVAAEYFENRLGVIEAQSDAYAKSISGLKVAKDKFNSGSRHPFVSDEVFNQYVASYDLMIKELENRQKTYLSLVSDDSIKVRIGDLLNGRVGQPYSEQQLNEVSVEGEQRYLENIPPGFEDGGKMPEATTTKLKLKKFGDLILWKQIIDKAVSLDKPVVLVTGEKKDDWWLKSSKGLVSALPALTKEFMAAVKQDFYLYATDRFLLKANDYLKQSTSAVVVEEVRAINKADADSYTKNIQNYIASSMSDKVALDPWAQRINLHLNDMASDLEEASRSPNAWELLMEEALEAESKITLLTDQINSIQKWLEEYREILPSGDASLMDAKMKVNLLSRELHRAHQMQRLVAEAQHRHIAKMFGHN